MNSALPVLSVENLVTSYQTHAGAVRAVDNVSMSVPRRAKLGIVGESGCGKTTLALSILRLLSFPARTESGKVLLGNQDLLTLTERQMCGIRGRRVSMVFQEPMTSLNPVQTVGSQIAEAVRIHEKVSRKQALERAMEMLHRVGMPSPASRLKAWPHELSGGMRQRVMIAMAMICGPEVLLADEPTTALDVTVQAQILEALARLQEDTGTAIVFITHDLALLGGYADEVIVMYAGQVVESSPVTALFSSPAHPYTDALLQSAPLWSRRNESASKRLATIPGRVPDLQRLPRGCRFQDRCSRADDLCRTETPDLEPVSDHRRVRCFHPLGAS